MSTTDTGAAFEAWAITEGLISDSHGIRFVNSMCEVARKAFNAGIAHTEAAKATSTAGELSELPQCFGSIDVYHDSGQVTSVDGWTADQMRGYAIDYAMQLGLAARQPAPALPVKQWEVRAHEAGLMVRSKEKMFDHAIAEIADWRAYAAASQDMDAAKRLRLICKMVGIESNVPDDDGELWGCAFAVLGQIRAALAATAAPVLSDEQMDDNDRELLILSIQDLNELASGETGALGTDNLLKPGGMKKATMADVKRKLPYVVKRLRNLVAKLDGAATNRSQP